MRSKLKVNDKKWQELKRKIPSIKNAAVTVGIQSDAGSDDDEDSTPLAAIAFWNEQGTDGGGWGGPIPERPFMRDTFDQQKDKWGRAADTAISAILSGKFDPERAFGVLGQMSEDDIKAAITNGDWVKNSEATIELKGSSQPLIDTGAMRQAIRYEVKL